MGERLDTDCSKDAAKSSGLEPEAAEQNDNSLNSELFDQVRAAAAKPLRAPVKQDHTKNFEILPGKTPVDPDRPKVVVLDDYRYGDIPVTDKFAFSHGELSARMAEENDLNVIRMQLDVKQNGEYDMPKALKNLDQAIEDGKVDLGKNDILNLSFANTTTYKSMSYILGMEITAANVKEKRAEIFSAMKSQLDAGGLSDERRKMLEELVGINEGIRRLQARGMEVIAGGGNDGPDKFNFGFLMADKQYSALTSTGKQADYSAASSLTEDGRGQVDFYFHKVDLFNPVSIEKQQGYYSIDGTKIKLPAGELGYPNLNKLKFNLNAQLGWDHAAQKPSSLESLPFTTLTSKLVAPDFATWRKGHLVATAEGTSFVNIFKLPAEYKKLSE